MPPEGPFEAFLFCRFELVELAGESIGARHWGQGNEGAQIRGKSGKVV